MKLNQPWDPAREIGVNTDLHYKNKRCLVETTTGGSYYFLTEGKLTKKAPPQPVPPAPQQQPAGLQLKDERIYEGWKYESTSPV
jgi:hypothetical protein